MIDRPVSPPSPYDDPTPCPECGVGDAEYGLHAAGCPSGYPTTVTARRCQACGFAIVYRSRRSAWTHRVAGADHAPAL